MNKHFTFLITICFNKHINCNDKHTKKNVLHFIAAVCYRMVYMDVAVCYCIVYFDVAGCYCIVYIDVAICYCIVYIDVLLHSLC